MKIKIIGVISVLMSWLLQPVVFCFVMFYAFGIMHDPSISIRTFIYSVFLVWVVMALVYPFFIPTRKWISSQISKRKARKKRVQFLLLKILSFFEKRPPEIKSVEPPENISPIVSAVTEISIPFFTDPMFDSAVEAVVDAGFAGTSLLQRRLKINYARATRIMDEMEQCGIVGPFEGAKPRKVLLTPSQLKNTRFICDEEKILSNTYYETSTTDYEYLDGHQFEEFCANLLRMNGFTAEVTQASGDHGVDVLAEKDGIRYAIQCKKYSGSVPYSAIQQANTGKQLYNCDIAVVMTNSAFTKQTIEDAKKLNIRLWGKEQLDNMVLRADNIRNAEQKKSDIDSSKGTVNEFQSDCPF